MIITKTPLRLSFVGGGTDLPEFYENYGDYGSVVSTTINKFIYITANRKFDKKIRLSYSKTELVDDIDQIEHNVIRETLRFVGITDSIEIVYMADLPLTGGGSGLGSSSSLTVGLLKALYALKEQHVGPIQLASEAYKIEREILGHPVGKQDHYAAAFGGLNHIKFKSDGDVFVDPIICNNKTKDILNSQMVMFFTGTDRISSTILDSQSKTVANKVLNYRTLVEMADEFASSLQNNDIQNCYKIMEQGWVQKKKLSEKISSDAFDTLHKKAMQAGCLAGKIAGAGGGGFLFFLCPSALIDDTEKALSEIRRVDVQMEPQGCQIIHVS